MADCKHGDEDFDTQANEVITWKQYKLPLNKMKNNLQCYDVIYTVNCFFT